MRKNVRICSPSLALTEKKKKKNIGAPERYCCWSSQVPICVPAPCDPPPSDPWPLSFLCWTPTHGAVNHLQAPWGCHWVTNLAGGDQSQTSSPSPTEADQRLTLLHFWYSSSCVVPIPKRWMALRDAAHPLTTKGIESNHLLSPNSWTVTKLQPNQCHNLNQTKTKLLPKVSIDFTDHLYW